MSKGEDNYKLQGVRTRKRSIIKEFNIPAYNTDKLVFKLEKNVCVVVKTLGEIFLFFV